jgi:RNA-binding protein YlmH
LKGIDNLDRISRVLDQTDQAVKAWEVVFADFLSPLELAEAQTVLAKLTEVSAIAWGGYPQAERQRLAIGVEPAITQFKRR